MRLYKYSVGVVATLTLAIITSSCSDRLQEENTPLKKRVALEVCVEGINETRSLVTGNALPDNCRFYIYYKSITPIGVNYRNGVCTIEEPIYLEESDGNNPVYALYPVKTDLNELAISYMTQNDYLRGISIDQNGIQANPTVDNPKVSIRFEHILSRITLNIHKDASIDGYYKLSEVYLGGDRNNSFRVGAFDIESNRFTYTSTYEFQDIKGELKDNNYLLETPDDVVTVDFLVIPSQTGWSVKIPGVSSSWWTLPDGNYEAGKQYVYDCILTDKDSVYLTITECEIRPWETTEMPELETY